METNIKHHSFGSRLTSIKGKELFNAGTDLKCNFVSGRGCTYWPSDPNKLPDLIDFFITKGISTNYYYVEYCYDLISDYNTVIMILNKLIVEKSIKITLENTNWVRVRKKIAETITLKVSL